MDIRRATLGLAAMLLAVSIMLRFCGDAPAWPLLKYLIAWNFDFLLAGMCIALGWNELPATWRDVASRYALAGVIAMLIVAAFFPSPLVANEMRSRFVMPLMIVAYAGIVAAGSDERAFPWKLPIYGSMVWLGERSYSVYLFHFPVMAAIWFGLVRFAPPIWTIEPLHYGVAQMLLALLIVLPLSSLSLRWVENPARRLGSRWRKSLTRPRAVLAAEIA
jgi:peptidoglycan/LPS O-acetylase OafA/YrhL